MNTWLKIAIFIDLYRSIPLQPKVGQGWHLITL